jgi:hypothetical protein
VRRATAGADHFRAARDASAPRRTPGSAPHRRRVCLTSSPSGFDQKTDFTLGKPRRGAKWRQNARLRARRDHAAGERSDLFGGSHRCLAGLVLHRGWCGRAFRTAVPVWRRLVCGRKHRTRQCNRSVHSNAATAVRSSAMSIAVNHWVADSSLARGASLLPRTSTDPTVDVKRRGESRPGVRRISLWRKGTCDYSDVHRGALVSRWVRFGYRSEP